MFLKRLSVALVTITCLGFAAVGAAPNTLTTATNTGKENSALAPLAVDFSYTIDKPTCSGDNDGSINITINSSSSGPFKVEYAIGAGSYIVFYNSTLLKRFPITGLTANTYKVKITDISVTPNQNLEKINIIISDFPLLNLTLNQKTDCTCSGLSNGTIQLFASGGDNSSYTYSLKNSSNNPVGGTNSTGLFSNLPANTYTGYVTDGNGCLRSFSNIQISSPIAIVQPTIIIDSIDFPGDKAVINLSGLPSDPASYQLLFDNVSSGVITGTSAVISNVSAGLHLLKIQSKSCTTDVWPDAFGQTITITDFLPVNFSWDVGDPNSLSLNCFGDDTTFTVTVNGGRVGKTVNLVLYEEGISRPLASALPFGLPYPISNLKAGVNYKLFAYNTDDSELRTSEFEISGPTIPFEIADVATTNVSCNGLDNGTALVSKLGGSSTIYYTIDNGLSFPLLLTNKTITGLEGDKSYNIVLKDDKGCLSDTMLFSIDEPDPISISVLTNLTEQLSCPNTLTGKIYARAYGGNKPYYYTLKNAGIVVNPYLDKIGGDTIVFSNLSDGNYEVSVKDGVCPTTVSDIETIEPLTVSLNIDFDPIKCNNGKTNIYVSASGGIGSLFTYNIINTETSTSLLPQTETNSGTGVTFNDVAASSYRIQANYSSCTPTFEDTLIDNPALLTVTFPSTVNVKCPGDFATIVISATGSYPFQISTDGINYSNFTSQSSNTITNLAAGSYSYYIKDKYDCVFNNGLPITITVVEPTSIVTDSPIIEDAKCKSGKGSVSLKVSGGTPGYTLNLIDGLNSFKGTSTTGLDAKILVPAGTYNLEIKDRNGCIAPTPPTGIEVKEPPLLKLVDPIFDPILCNGNTTQVDFSNSVSGGWPGVGVKNIEIFGIATSFQPTTLQTLSAGRYIYTATSNDDCIATDTFTIGQPTPLVLDSFKVTDFICNESNDAQIVIWVKGGVPDYNYGLRGKNSVLLDISFLGPKYIINQGLAKDTYQLTIKDKNNCYTEPVSVSVNKPDKVTFNIRQNSQLDSVSCFGFSDGQIYIQDPKGGFGSFTAYLTLPDGTIEKRPDFPYLKSLPTGDYSVILKDSKGCSSDLEKVTIGEPTKINFDKAYVLDSLKCYGDANASIEVIATGGLHYTLQYKISGAKNEGYKSGNKFTGLPNGEYNVFVSILKSDGKNYCDAKFPDKLKISPRQEIKIERDNAKNVSCHNLLDGSALIKAGGGTGGLQYYFTNMPDDKKNTTGKFSNLGEFGKTSTRYNYNVEDEKGCIVDSFFNIRNPDELLISELDFYQVSCYNKNDGWIKVKVSGGTGGYTFKRNFTDLDTIVNSVFRENPYFTLKNFPGGNYKPLVLDKNFCTDTLSTSITIKNPDPLKIVEPIDWGIKECNGDMDDSTIIHITGGTPGIQYSLDNGASYSAVGDSIFVGEPLGNKFPRVKDKNGCETPDKSNEPYRYTGPDSLIVKYIFIPIECHYDKYGVEANGNMELKIKGGTGPYTLGIDDENFSSGTTYNINKAIVTDITTVNLSENLNINLAPDHGYSFYLRDINNCPIQNISSVRTFTDVFADTTFKRPSEVILDTIWSYPVRCENDFSGQISFRAIGGTAPSGNEYYIVAKHEISGLIEKSPPGFKTVGNLPSGKFQCTVYDKNNCKAIVNVNPKKDFWKEYSDTITVQYKNESLNLKYSGITLPLCDRTYDGEIKINISDFFGGGILYNVLMWDEVIDTFSLPFVNEGEIDADKNYSKKEGTRELFYRLDTSIVKDIGIGRYLITVIDSITGCATTLDTTLYSIQGDSCPPIRYYNAFTPLNDDIYNNVWTLYGSERQNYTLRIYTGYGELVYIKKGRSDKDGIKWDGLDNKQRPVPVGTYIYLLRKNEGTPADTLINGNISILRDNGR